MDDEKSKKAAIYIKAGLDEQFAWAIANGTDSKEIMDMWESNWWKQNSEDDPLIRAVLNGELTQEQGKWLNSIRSDHERLALTCVENPEMIEWATTILDTEFNNHPKLIEGILDGGEPEVLARIVNMEVDKDLLPPALKNSVELKNPPSHLRPKEPPGGPPSGPPSGMRKLWGPPKPPEEYPGMNWREDVLLRVMKSHGIKDRDGFLAHAIRSRVYGCGYLNEADLEVAANAWNTDNAEVMEDVPSEGKKQGTVKWFNYTKGYGFIEREGEDQLFVHISEVTGEITDGDTVSFEVGEGSKGPNAVNVLLINKGEKACAVCSTKNDGSSSTCAACGFTS